MGLVPVFRVETTKSWHLRTVHWSNKMQDNRVVPFVDQTVDCRMTMTQSLRPILTWMRIIGIELDQLGLNMCSSALRRAFFLCFGVSMLLINVMANYPSLSTIHNQWSNQSHSTVISSWNMAFNYFQSSWANICIHCSMLVVAISRWRPLWKCFDRMQTSMHLTNAFHNQLRRVTITGTALIITVTQSSQLQPRFPVLKTFLFIYRKSFMIVCLSGCVNGRRWQLFRNSPTQRASRRRCTPSVPWSYSSVLAGWRPWSFKLSSEIFSPIPQNCSSRSMCPHISSWSWNGNRTTYSFASSYNTSTSASEPCCWSSLPSSSSASSTTPWSLS